MENIKGIGVILAVIILIIGNAMIFGSKKRDIPKDLSSTTSVTSDLKNAYFAGGCFWCLEGIFESQEGVIEAFTGYIGGSAETANYKDVSSGNTLHREGVQVIYDPTKISYAKLVELFWTQIDPTDEGGQFADRGYHYTTAIYYDGEQERKIAEMSKKSLEDSGKFQTSLATKIISIDPFYKAEYHHQNYYKKAAGAYKTYARLSGRKGFIEDYWSEEISALTCEGDNCTGGSSITGQQLESIYSDDALKKRLTPLQYKVTQQDGTEPAFKNEYWDNKEPGIYVDIIDGTPLYSSLDKFDSGTGWPSFTKSLGTELVTEHTDTRFFMTRIEVRSASSDAHLGHVFNDAPAELGGIRHCINSAALRFVPVEDLETQGYGEYVYLFQ